MVVKKQVGLDDPKDMRQDRERRHPVEEAIQDREAWRRELDM